jgi:predicted house-cleaning noncanonical NTP pyrophosphatase (MazG superfamily)
MRMSKEDRDKLDSLIEKSRRFLTNIAEDSKYPLKLSDEYTEESLETVQEYVGSLNQEGLEEKYVQIALLAMAVYLGDLLKKEYPESHYNGVFEDGHLESLILQYGSQKIYLLNVVRKAKDNPNDNDLSIKFPLIKSQLKNVRKGK